MSPREASAILAELGLTQNELAILLGVYQSTVSRWLDETRRSEVPRMLALILELLRDFPAARERYVKRTDGGR